MSPETVLFIDTYCLVWHCFSWKLPSAPLHELTVFCPISLLIEPGGYLTKLSLPLLHDQRFLYWIFPILKQTRTKPSFNPPLLDTTCFLKE